MTRYNRDILVPYLQNICALYLVRERLRNWYWNASKKVDVQEVYYHKPQIPDYKDPIGCIFYLLVGFVVFFLILARIAYKNTNNWMMVIICVILALICLNLVVVFIRDTEAKNKQMREEYNAQLIASENSYFEEVERVKQEKNKIQKRMDGYLREINRIDALLDKLYSANIIPTMYRDSYAAIYLYDWFRTGSSDDLDHALSMYVLEQIKSRLDTIIDNQSQMIINQSMMMANQVRSMEQRRLYEKQMMAKMDQLQVTADEKLRYTRMIESNTAALNFFATANYLRNN